MRLRSTQTFFAVIVATGLFAISIETVADRAQSQDRSSRVDRRADRLLRRMSDYLAGLRSFEFTADHTTEVVTKDGQKLQFVATSDVAVQRPNRFRSHRRGEVADASLYYDGDSLTIHGKRLNFYAQAPAPPTLDRAIDFAREQLDMEAPAADMIYSEPYEILMEDVVSGRYVGTAEIDGRTCHHLAYRGREVDWQLWIADGDRPLPCRYVIVTKNVKAAPEFGVEFRRWNTRPELSAEAFEFRPPQGAKRIEFLSLKAGARAKLGERRR
jgi:hypothetical protein